MLHLQNKDFQKHEAIFNDVFCRLKEELEEELEQEKENLGIENDDKIKAFKEELDAKLETTRKELTEKQEKEIDSTKQRLEREKDTVGYVSCLLSLDKSASSTSFVDDMNYLSYFSFPI